MRGTGNDGGGWQANAWTFVAVLVFYFAMPVRADGSTWRLVLDSALTFAGLAGVCWVVSREVRRLVHSVTHVLTLTRLILLLELVFVAFALAYYLLAVNTDQMAGIRTRIDALYFSATTMTTVGYGDIHAVGQFARALTTVQLVFDVLFVAGLVRLAGRHHREITPKPDS